MSYIISIVIVAALIVAFHTYTTWGDGIRIEAYTKGKKFTLVADYYTASGVRVRHYRWLEP